MTMQNNTTGLCSTELFKQYKRKKTNLLEHRDNLKCLLNRHGEVKTLHRKHVFKNHEENFLVTITPTSMGSIVSHSVYRHMEALIHKHSVFPQSFEQMLWDRKLQHCEQILWTFPPLQSLMQFCAGDSSLLKPKTMKWCWSLQIF